MPPESKDSFRLDELERVDANSHHVATADGRCLTQQSLTRTRAVRSARHVPGVIGLGRGGVRV